MWKRRDRSAVGAAAVEFALVAPILLMLLIGVVTVAFAYSSKVALTNAVREGARTGATAPVSSTWGASVVSRVTSAYADPGVGEVKVCAMLYKGPSASPVQSGGDASVCGSNAAPSGTEATTCYVKVWATKPAALEWLLGSGIVTLHAQSVEIYDRSRSCNPPPATP